MGDPIRAARKIDKPWGYELVWAETADYVGKVLHIEAGQRLSYQYHRVKEETVYVLSGRIRVHYADGDEAPRVVELGPGDGFHVPTGLRHRFEAIETSDVAEASTPYLDDVVRLEDVYGRSGGDS